MELVLETLHVPTKEDLKGEGPASTTIAPAQPVKDSVKDKIVLKIK